MPWQANNNPAGDIRAPAISAALRQKQQQQQEKENRVWRYKLRTILLNEIASEACSVDGVNRCCGLVNPKDFPRPDEGECNAIEYIYPRQHAQFVVTVRADDRVPRGSIALSQPQLINLELCVGQSEEWQLYQEHVPMIAAVSIEIRPVQASQLTKQVVIDANDFAAAFAKYTWQRILTENERLVMKYGDSIDYFVRVLEVDAEDDSETEFTMPDSFRGQVDEETKVYVSWDGVLNERIELRNAAVLEGPLASHRADVVTVVTSDEEEFPVKKKLLYPCIKLTSAVLAGKGVHKDASQVVHVNVDCCTFDRVLLYLEHEARNDNAEFYFDPHYTEDLLSAAIEVGCIGLQEECNKRLGEFDSRVRKEPIRWDEVIRRNKSGEVWLAIDGMVLDVTRWLPEHPGGSVIIPREAINVDCTVMFEIYHSSRQSFRYLKQFYIGEIYEGDLPLIPQAPSKPSPGFVEQLKEYTKWRITPKVIAFKSF